MIDKEDINNLLIFIERDVKCAGAEAYAFVKAHSRLKGMLQMMQNAEKVAAQTPPSPAQTATAPLTEEALEK